MGIIVQFDVSQNALETLNGKTFLEGNQEWFQFVNEGRNNTLQHSFDFVEGPYKQLGIW